MGLERAFHLVYLHKISHQWLDVLQRKSLQFGGEGVRIHLRIHPRRNVEVPAFGKSDIQAALARLFSA